MYEIKTKLLDLQRRALTFASYGEILERDPLLVKEFMSSFAELKREQEASSDVQKRTHPEDTSSNSAGPSVKKWKVDVSLAFLSFVFLSEAKNLLFCGNAGIRACKRW